MSAVAEKLDDGRLALEKTGPAFTTERMLAVRGITRGAIHEIAARCKPGAWSRKTRWRWPKEYLLAGHGMVQGWHDVYVVQ